MGGVEEEEEERGLDGSKCAWEKEGRRVGTMVFSSGCRRDMGSLLCGGVVLVRA